MGVGISYVIQPFFFKDEKYNFFFLLYVAWPYVDLCFDIDRTALDAVNKSKHKVTQDWPSSMQAKPEAKAMLLVRAPLDT